MANNNYASNRPPSTTLPTQNVVRGSTTTPVTLAPRWNNTTNDRRCPTPDPRMNLTAAEASSVNEAGSTLNASTELQTALMDFARSAKVVQSLLDNGSQVHCFVSCTPNVEVGNSREPFSLYTIVSDLFHTALRTDNLGSRVTSHALRDAFLVASRATQITRQVAGHEQGLVRNPVSSSAQPTPVPISSSTPAFELPTWFPYVPPSTAEARREQVDRNTYILCSENVMKGLTNLGVDTLADLYATFFQSLWEKGYSQRRVTKKIVYSKLTPPYLRMPVVFMHGPHRSISLPFTQKVLPSKNQIRERNGKILGAAILATWLKRESCTAEYLAHLLCSRNVLVEFDCDSNSTIDVRSNALDQLNTAVASSHATLSIEQIMEGSADEQSALVPEMIASNTATHSNATRPEETRPHSRDMPELNSQVPPS